MVRLADIILPMAAERAYHARQLRSQGLPWWDVAFRSGYSDPTAAQRAVTSLNNEEQRAARLRAAYPLHENRGQGHGS